MGSLLNFMYFWIEVMTEAKPPLGIRIKQLRKQKGLSQDQVAEAAGIDPKSLSRIECNVFNPSLDTLQGLATALGVGMQEFFFNEADWSRLQKGYLFEAISNASDKEIALIINVVNKLVNKPKSRSRTKRQ
jgi:transcriptional regulator with XRE-family HTH domain